MFLASRLLLVRFRLRSVARRATSVLAADRRQPENSVVDVARLAIDPYLQVQPNYGDPAPGFALAARLEQAQPVVQPAAGAAFGQPLDDASIRAEVVDFLDRVEARERGLKALPDTAPPPAAAAIPAFPTETASAPSPDAARTEAEQLLAAARAESAELVRRGRAEAEKTLEWSRSQAAEIVRRSQRVAADRFAGAGAEFTVDLERS